MRPTRRRRPSTRCFCDEEAARGPRLPVVPGSTAGSPSSGRGRASDRLGYYVAQYDGEIAAVDQEVGRVVDALDGPLRSRDRTVVVLTSDHGESLGEHDYYFDHGEDLFDPSLRIPLIVVSPARRPGSGAAPSPRPSTWCPRSSTR